MLLVKYSDSFIITGWRADVAFPIFLFMKGTILISEIIVDYIDGYITLDHAMLSWDLLFEVLCNIKFRTYDLTVNFINVLTPSTYRHDFDCKPKYLTWICIDLENCPFVLEVVPFGKSVGKTGRVEERQFLDKEGSRP